MRRLVDDRLLLAAGLASLLDSAAIITVGTALPLWRSELDLGDWTVGAVSSCFTLFIAIGALLGGRAADRLGRARVFSATLGVYALGALVLALAPSPVWVLVGVVVLGVASGADLPASIALVAERASASARARMVARTQVLWMAGILLATAAGLASSPAGLSGIRVVFAGLAVLAVAALLARRSVLRTSSPVPPVAASAPDSRPRPVSARRLLVLVGAFYVVYTLVANTFGSFRTYLLVVVGGVDQTVATAVALGATVLGLGGTVVFSVVADTPWRRRLFPVGAVLMVTALVMLAVDGGRTLTVTAAALTVNSLAYPFVGEGLYKVWSQEVVAEDLRATYQGVTIALARTGAAAFALVTPSLMSWSASGLFAMLAVIATVSSCLGWAIMRATGPDGSGRSAVSRGR